MKNACSNRVIGHSSGKRVYQKDSPGKGYGLFIEERAMYGDYIIECIGEVISKSDYLMSIENATNPNGSYFLALGTNQILNLEKKGNKSRFINHSCSPNCEIQKVVLDIFQFNSSNFSGVLMVF